MAGSDLAAVLADIRGGRVRRAVGSQELHRAVGKAAAAAAAGSAPLVDATFIYETYLQKPQIAIYEDHPSILPPWREAFVGWRNEHGNANLTFTVADDWEPGMEWETATEAGNSFDGARYRLSLWMFGGGRTDGGRSPSPTGGPVALSRVAVHQDGYPLDINWVDLLGDGRPDRWDWSRWTVLGVYTLMNCRNVELVEAPMPRPERRREQRLGLRSHVIAVTSRGRRTRSQGGGAPASLPLHSVRGSIHHYGACCPWHEPKGLYFGRHTGRVFVPQYARGTADVGEVEQTFVVKADADG